MSSQVTPFEVKGKVDYDQLVNEFGVKLINQELLQRFEKVTGHKPHRLLRRGIFFAHRDLELILNDYEAKRPIFIYTGRGPSGPLHIGHYIPLEFTVWLQKVFATYVMFQIADDEKYYFKDLTREQVSDMSWELVYELEALGFNLNKTSIFFNSEYKHTESFAQVVDIIMKRVSLNTIQNIFGLDQSANIGQLTWPIYQTSAAFSVAYSYNDLPLDKQFKHSTRCLVVYAIDQDVYFRLARDVAYKINDRKPCSIISKFLPTLTGDGKMSSTNDTEVVITLQDTPAQIKKKINKYAFSGGRDTLEEHRKLGGNVDVDIPYQYLCHFLEDDEELAKIREEYTTGIMTSGEIKAKCIEVISQITEGHREKLSVVKG